MHSHLYRELDGNTIIKACSTTLKTTIVADSPDQIGQLVQFAADRQVEEIFVEPVNPRGPGLMHCQQALELWGHTKEAEAIKRIRNRANWSKYVLNLIHNVQLSVRKYSDTSKLRFLCRRSLAWTSTGSTAEP